jgi:hypothetical protein
MAIAALGDRKMQFMRDAVSEKTAREASKQDI